MHNAAVSNLNWGIKSGVNGSAVWIITANVIKIVWRVDILPSSGTNFTNYTLKCSCLYILCTGIFFIVFRAWDCHCKKASVSILSSEFLLIKTIHEVEINYPWSWNNAVWILRGQVKSTLRDGSRYGPIRPRLPFPFFDS